jgi:hypothetical protein
MVFIHGFITLISTVKMAQGTVRGTIDSVPYSALYAVQKLA